MAWFKRKEAGIQTDAAEQNEIPDGQWIKDPETGDILNRHVLEENAWVSPKSGHHYALSAEGYFDLIFDRTDDGERAFTFHDAGLRPTDPLGFVDTKPYPERLRATQKKTGLNDAIQAASGTVGGHPLSAAAMDFRFVGGSMGSVVGETIARAIRRGYEERMPVLVISQSGGARMMEGALSLMQMAKTSAHLAKLREAGQPFFSLMTNPTTGGVTASFAMLGDLNLAEPNALIGFAGPRVIRETIGADLPEGFQRAEFLLEKGFVDLIVDRRELRGTLTRLLGLFAN
ncbi:MAG: acetyl-CoA carboxylase, carboxyltransferase subunit beta [Rhodothermales bacterium]|nr:acetyl-CoA carboxylase, carboxyltransferase subunit beta [Rhodothermales bacterium]MCA0269632.1 acetyl-CoA carboxylase, carboxyltransferase subunit beta [Bacteroidota bacterium]